MRCRLTHDIRQSARGSAGRSSQRLPLRCTWIALSKPCCLSSCLADRKSSERPLGVHQGVCSTWRERARTRCSALPVDGPGKYKLNFYPEVRWSSTSYNIYITNPEYEVARGLTTVLGSAEASQHAHAVGAVVVR